MKRLKRPFLKAYELVPEAYKQKFRAFKKTPNQTYVELAREKGSLFDKWCASCKVTDLNSLRQLVLLEEFENCLLERFVVHLNEQKVKSLCAAAVLADEYVLTHKTSFHVGANVLPMMKSSSEKIKPTQLKVVKECFYYHKVVHVITNCLALKCKVQPSSQPKGVGLVDC